MPANNSRPGELNGSAKLTAEAVCVIRSASKYLGLTNAELGRRFGVSREQIRDIVRRKSWKHI